MNQLGVKEKGNGKKTRKKRKEERSWRIVEKKKDRATHLGIPQQCQCVTLPTQEKFWLTCIFCLVSPPECISHIERRRSLMAYSLYVITGIKQDHFYLRCSGPMEVLQKNIHISLLGTSWVLNLELGWWKRNRKKSLYWSFKSLASSQER